MLMFAREKLQLHKLARGCEYFGRGNFVMKSTQQPQSIVTLFF